MKLPAAISGRERIPAANPTGSLGFLYSSSLFIAAFKSSRRPCRCSASPLRSNGTLINCTNVSNRTRLPPPIIIHDAFSLRGTQRRVIGPTKRPALSHTHTRPRTTPQLLKNISTISTGPSLYAPRFSFSASRELSAKTVHIRVPRGFCGRRANNLFTRRTDTEDVRSRASSRHSGSLHDPPAAEKRPFS